MLFCVSCLFFIVDEKRSHSDDEISLPLCCQSASGETEDPAAKTGQSNGYFVQQIVANLESSFLLDVV